MTPFELDHFTGYSTNAEYEAEIREQQERDRWHRAYQSLVIKIFPDWHKDMPECHMWEVCKMVYALNGNREVYITRGLSQTFDGACACAKYAAYEYADLIAAGA